MALLGVEGLVYGADDVETVTRFYEDVGLKAVRKDKAGTDFVLPDNSRVVIRRSEDPSLRRGSWKYLARREVIWGVDSPAALATLAADLERDREVLRACSGSATERPWKVVGAAEIARMVFQRVPADEQTVAARQLHPALQFHDLQPLARRKLAPPWRPPLLNRHPFRAPRRSVRFGEPSPIACSSPLNERVIRVTHAARRSIPPSAAPRCRW